MNRQHKSSLTYFFILAAAVSLFAACSRDKGAAAPSKVQIDKTNDGSIVEIAFGGTLTITLPSNPGTGYTWTVVDPTGGMSQQGDPTYVPPSSTRPEIGGTGTQVFKFKAVKRGENYKLGLGSGPLPQPDTLMPRSFEISVNVK